MLGQAKLSSADSMRSKGLAGTQQFYTVQALRAMAAMMVVLHHALQLIEDRLTHRPAHYWPGGALGVDIFFVISGLVMTLSSHPLLRAAHGARTFLARRMERVVPLYWFATSVKLLLLFAIPGAALNHFPAAWHIVSSFLFFPPGGGDSYFPVLVVGWTLTYEMMFYLLFAIALALRIPLTGFLMVTISSIAVAGCVVRPNGMGVLFLLNPIVLEFLYGVLLGRTVQLRRLPGAMLSWILLVAGAGVLMAMAYEQGWVMRPFACGLPALAIVTGAVGLEDQLRARIPKWVLRLGDSSYSLYLTHGLVLPVVGLLVARLHRTDLLTLILVVIACLLLSVAVGEGCYHAFELPLIRFFRGRRLQAAPVLDR